MTDKDGKTAVIQQNRYNGDGQRIQKVEGSKTTNYYYQDGVVSYTTDGDNSQTSQNLIGTDGNILATQKYGSDHTDYLLYHKDIQGSTTSLVKEDGSADATYRYTDFGETTINGDNKAENEVCYTGGIYDQSTGLYYLNARYYNPEDGRFVTEDTYRGETNEPDTQNLYNYCEADPINYVDPSGHKDLKINKYYTGFSYNKKGKYFYSKVNCWQRKFGYNNLYDYGSRVVNCNILWIKSYFNAKNHSNKKKKWRIELWKGNYGVTMGGEIGLYYKKESSKVPHYEAVSNSDMMKMSYKLTYRTLKGKTKKIIERKETRHWWLNGFKFGHAWSIRRLHLDVSVEFPNSNMAKLFCNNLSKSASTSRKNKRVRIKW